MENEQLLLPGHSQCANCDVLAHQDVVVTKAYFTATMWQEEHFCSDECHHEWYIKRLNNLGL
jgi:hypothetical protein